MNAHARIAAETVGFGAPAGVDPHCFEVMIPPGNSGEIAVVERYGVAAGAFGRPFAERCVLTRKVWGAIRDDVKRHFNERLKEKDMATGVWSAGVNKVERLLGQELLTLCWGVEAADPELIYIGVRNWLALRPEERWWLYAITAAATGEVKHRDIGWRKALRFALTENPIREALTPMSPSTGLLLGARARRKGRFDPDAPRLPGFEDAGSPFSSDAQTHSEDVNAATLFPEERAVANRTGAARAEDLGGGAEGAKSRGEPNTNGSRILLEGPQTSRSGQGLRTRRASPRHG